MENASKALIMAAGVMISLMILSIGIILFSEYGQLGSMYSNKMSEQEVLKFNSNFTSYENRTDITAYEIVSLINFVTDYKEKTDIEVTVDYPNRDNYKSNLTDFIKNESEKRFTCTNIVYNGPFDTVSQITFSETR